jgi:2-dehydro-3-deoxyphosphogluconate aldolase/(4S)-4-hydroxy-2-oxoglutarate aldolase
MVQFIPTGGITAENAAPYLQLQQVLACGGSWMVQPDMVSAGEFAAITKLAEEAVMATAGLPYTQCSIVTLAPTPTPTP